jgi:hypothetical protein
MNLRIKPQQNSNKPVDKTAGVGEEDEEDDGTAMVPKPVQAHHG